MLLLFDDDRYCRWHVMHWCVQANEDDHDSNGMFFVYLIIDFLYETKVNIV